MTQRDPRKNILAEEYEIECTHPGCPGKQKIEHASSAGLQIGMIVPVDSAVPAFGRCQFCKRNAMRVTKVPTPAPPPSVLGFPRGVPEK